MKIYTKTGDKGQTSLFGGTRVPKHHIRIESYGTVDELNSYIGLIRDLIKDKNSQTFLTSIQDKLFVLGATLATPPEKETLKNGTKRLKIRQVETKDIEALEQEIDAINAVLPAMTHFILPGGHPTVSHCHIARCICRRAERICTLLNESESIDNAILQYLNRLSDYLFVLARKIAKDENVKEILWNT
jgi:cob(I)alamin adenosyltransferase